MAETVGVPSVGSLRPDDTEDRLTAEPATVPSSRRRTPLRSGLLLWLGVWVAYVAMAVVRSSLAWFPVQDQAVLDLRVRDLLAWNDPPTSGAFSRYAHRDPDLAPWHRFVAEDFADKDVHCGIVSPGPVDTNFFGEELEAVANLVFSQPLSTADEVAEAVLECIEKRAVEIAVPSRSGTLATTAYVFPSIADRLRPMLEKRGAKAKKKYIATKRGKA